MEVLVGLGLASAAGLNAYLPLLLLGALARTTDLVPLPEAWSWLSDPVALAVLAVLLLVEVVADKVPGVDHLNDVLGAVVRPAAGGIAVGAGTAGPAGTGGEWWAVALGAVVALVVTVAKSAGRAAVNATTVGTGAPVASTLEDGASLALSLSALMAPVLVLAALVALVGGTAVAVLRLRHRRGARPRGRIV